MEPETKKKLTHKLWILWNGVERMPKSNGNPMASCWKTSELFSNSWKSYGNHVESHGIIWKSRQMSFGIL